MHYVAATVLMLSLLLYVDRSATLWVNGGQSAWGLVTRAGLSLLLTSLVVGFLDLAGRGDPFLWRHWLVFGAGVFVVVGHVGMRLNQDPPT